MSGEAEYEQWLDSALAFEANWRSPRSSYDSQDEIVDRVDSCWPEDLSEEWFRLDSSGYRDRQTVMSAEEEHEQWLDSALALEANLTSPYSAFEVPEELPDSFDAWWPKSLYEEWSRPDASNSRDRRRALRLRGRRKHERVHIHVRQKLWKGARAMALRFRRSYGACAPERRHGVRSRDISPTHRSADTASATASTFFTRVA